jgi:hypothetical protein
MRIIVANHRLILLAALLTAGVSIAGWAFACHYNLKTQSLLSQTEVGGDIQPAAVNPEALDHRKIVLFLVGAGLIGFFGVRRQGNPRRRPERVKRPRLKFRINLLTKEDLKGR